MSIKLGIAGTHSTGKTTLVDAVAADLADAGYRVGKIANLAIEAKNNGFPILREHSFASTLWIMSRGIALELQSMLESDVVLVDRPIPDALGYLFAALQHRGERLPSWQLEYLQSLSRHHSLTYNRLFRTQIDPQKPVDQGKARDLDPNFRAAAAREIDHVFVSLEIPCDLLATDARKAKRQMTEYAFALLKETNTRTDGVPKSD